MTTFHTLNQSQQQELLELFIKKTPAAIAIFDREMRYIAASDRWLKDYNLTNKNVVGKSHYEIFPTIPERWKKVHSEVMTTGEPKQNDEDSFEDESGDTIWIKWEVTPWYIDNTIGGIIMFTEVITDQKLQESELVLSNQTFKAAFNTSATGIALVSLDGKWLRVNKALCDMLNYTEDEMLALTFQDITHPDDLQKDLSLVEQLKHGEIETYQLEKRYIKKDKSILPIILSVGIVKDANTPKFFVSQITDISEFRNTKARDEAILLSIGDGMFATDINGNVILVNETFEHLLGWSKDEIIGKYLYDYLQMIDKKGNVIASNERLLTKALQGITKKIETFNKISYQKKDGTLLPVSITVAPIIDEGEVVGAVEVFRDSTREVMEDESKSQFISLASHQLRTPLTSIRWYSEMLQKGIRELTDEEIQSYVDTISKSSNRMVELVNRLLDVSRIELETFLVEPTPTALNVRIVTILEKVTQKYLDKNLTIHKNIQPVPEIPLDINLIDIVIDNLVTNGFNYAFSDTDLYVTLVHSSAGSEFGGRVFNEDRLCFAITNKGIGIPDNNKDKIFSKMYRGDNAQQVDASGTGLGLFISKHIITLAHGEIWFVSEVDKETTFFFAIPLDGMQQKEGTKYLGM